MRNQDTAWIFVRAFGVYFLVQAFLELFSMGVTSTLLYSLYEIVNSSTTVATVEKAESNILRNWSYFGTYTVQYFVFSVLSFYCLRKGFLIHKLLMYRATANENT
ncbi:hypothetical protein [Arenicella xantha]|uniref:Uncharacterized protein n=1 Tax=Arenicella xantha TaxID=644221 RepID=A0A395JEB2_9GAMM|nr:hypothetical protein [Arenicella xantha]RBP47017.1 hypothetical protein DFR28_1121 [Arenicella xantha]